MRLFCHVVGTNALIAGYAYLGQNVPSLQKDLENSIYVFQKRLLDAIAQSNREIPWNNVPHLLTIDGISDLVELYNSTSSNTGKSSSTRPRPMLAKDSGSEEKSESSNKKRKVREMKLPKVTDTARKLHGFLSNSLSCSECGYKSVRYTDEICPNCNRRFV